MNKLIIFLFLPFSLMAGDLSKTYYIKGMSCGMCVDTITSSLKKAQDLDLDQSKVEVGSVTIKLKKDDKDVNCKLVKAIEGTTEYKVFLDKEYLKPACPKS